MLNKDSYLDYSKQKYLTDYILSCVFAKCLLKSYIENTLNTYKNFKVWLKE